LRILVLGANGFIGARVAACLRARGHEVLPCGRNTAALRLRFPGSRVVRADLSRDNAGDWHGRLGDIDAVVNAVGALEGKLEILHGSGPAVLFDACAEAGIPRVVQVSALGAADGTTRFLGTKRMADEHLLRLRREGGRRGWTVLRPSLVVGRGGYSTGLFSSLAVLPRPVGLGQGNWQVQPIHVADLARCIADLIKAGEVPPVLDLVGPEPMGTDRLTAILRGWLGLPERRPVSISEGLLRVGARIGRLVPGSPLTSETLDMLARGNTADPATARAALGWSPRRLVEALAEEPSVAADRTHARMAAVRPVLRLLLATIWVGTAYVSAFVTPRAVSDALTAGLGLHGLASSLALWGGVALDLAVGIAVLALPRQTVLVCMIQLAVTLLLTVLATAAFPGAWADPFGPLLKNAAIVGAVLALLAARE
jgi:nucleoside-diphosphate-sugar epimerase